MIFAWLLGIFAAGSGLILLYPLLRSSKSQSGADAEMAVYRDQLAEIERDFERSTIDEDAARAARNEIERRMLRTARRHREQAEQASGQPHPAARKGGRIVMLLLVILVLPLGTAGLYFQLGSPGKQDMPLAGRGDERDNRDVAISPEVEAMVARLEARLEEDPNDLEGWMRLGRSKQVMGAIDQSVEAYRKALALAPADPVIKATLAETLVNAAQGVVTPDARTMFEEVAAIAPEEPRAGYFLGLAELQAGNGNAAFERWQAILARTPRSVSWRQPLEQAIADTARRMEMDIAGLLEVAPPETGPGQAAGVPVIDDETRAHVDAMSESERQAMIENMVTSLETRLNEQGGSAAEWQRLGRSKGVLGDKAASESAFAKAAELAPDDPAILREYAMSLMDETDPASNLPRIPDDAAVLLEKLVVLVPEDAEIHWYLGVRKLQTGSKEAAIVAWKQALDLTPADHPDRAALETLINQLEEKS